MSPELQELLKQALVTLIANLPQIILYLGTILYYLKQIRNKSNTFPSTVAATETNIVTKFEAFKTDVNSNIGNMNQGFTLTLASVREEISKKINDTLIGMKGELKTYRETVEQSAQQVNLLVKQNAVAFDIISSLLSKDPELIKEGIASALSKKLTMTKEEMASYSKILVEDKDALLSALREYMVVAGMDNLESLLKEIGYGKETKN